MFEILALSVVDTGIGRGLVAGTDQEGVGTKNEEEAALVPGTTILIQYSVTFQISPKSICEVHMHASMENIQYIVTK